MDEKDLNALEGYGELLLKSEAEGERYLGALTSIVARMVRLLPVEERTRLFERVQAGEGVRSRTLSIEEIREWALKEGGN